MTAYIDVGVTRIQEYLTRTSGADTGQLRKRRGASRMVADATDADAFHDLGLERNDESYHVEGVVHLWAPDVVNVSHAQELALAVAGRLRQKLPQAYLQATWVVAETYSLAYPKLKIAREMNAGDNAGSVALIPALRDDPFAGRCDSCGLAAPEDGKDCEDCLLRHGAGAGRQPSGATETPEARALEALATKTGVPMEAPEDLSKLAGLLTDPRGKRNHLATVYADGNSVGSLFAGIVDRSRAKEVSVAVDSAIRLAGEDALQSLLAWCDEGLFPAAVTVLAADDALITVPAALGWVFAQTMVAKFGEAVQHSKVIGELAETIGPGFVQPSLSAGIAFTHVKSPIEAAIQASAAAMREAKKHHSGVAAVGWVDLTHPVVGAAPTATVEWLRHRRTILDHVAGLPQSQRSQWERDIVDSRAASVEPEKVNRFFISEFRRLGHEELESAEMSISELELALSLARWWAPPRRREELTEGRGA